MRRPVPGSTPPALDEKVLTGWNGLAIGALAHAGFVFDDARAIEAARRAADFLLAHHLLADGTPVRASLDGVVSSAAATLEDTGMLAGGLLELAVATGDASYAVTARALIDRAAAAAAPGPTVPFAAPSGGDPVLVARGLALPTDPAEGATPSGITACADAAWRLFALGAGPRYVDLAEAAMRGVAGIAIERPIAFGGSLGVMARLAAPLVQLVTVVPDDASDEMRRRGLASSAPRRAGTRHPSPPSSPRRRPGRSRRPGSSCSRAAPRRATPRRRTAADRSCAPFRCTTPVRSRRSSRRHDRSSRGREVARWRQRPEEWDTRSSPFRTMVG